MWRILLLLVCAGLSGIVYASGESTQTLQLFSREQAADLNISLDENHWRWLGDKNTIRVGTWAPENPPFDIVTTAGIYEGINADYINFIAHNLRLTPVIFRYASRDKALQALSNHEIDTVLDDGGSVYSEAEDYVESEKLITNLPTLVTRELITSGPVSGSRVVKVAVSQGYLRDQQIIQYIPNALIVRFPSSQRALTCVALEKCDVFLGNLVTTSFLIEKNYSNTLTIKNIYPEVDPGVRFLFQKKNIILQQSINAVLQVIPESLQRVITRQWVQREDIWRFEKPLLLTEREKEWIKKKPTITIIIDPFFAPYSMTDHNGEFHGISADILRLIHLRTGLDFRIVTADSVSQMFNYLEKHRGDVIAVSRFSQQSEAFVAYTRPWHHTPSVLVVKDTPTAPPGLNNSLTLATVRNDAISANLAKEWPGIRWVYVDNERLVLQMVNSGKVDGGVSTQLGANFMIDRDFRGRLKIAERLGDQPELISFAVHRNAPELLGILNKAIADILPQEISLIVHRWQGVPDVTVNTWEVHSKKFYWVLGICAGLIGLALIWGFIRGREAQRRKRAQVELQSQLAFRETLINGSPAPIYVLNQEFIVITYNQAFRDYFALLPEGSLRYSLFDFRHPLYQLREPLTLAFNQNYDAVGTGNTQEFVVNNGAELRVIAHWATPYFDVQNKIAGMICGWQDITQHKQLLEALSVEKELAEQANQAKSTFLATMSHEIRTPISAILGLLELEVRSQPSNDAVRVSFESAQTLMELIGDVLDMAKIESGELVLSMGWVHLNTAITPVIRVFEEVAKRKGLALHVDNRTDTDLEVFIDDGRLRQSIANYLSNAVKFTEHGQINVRLHSQHTTPGNLILHIEIEDTGVGMTISDQKQLFKPFAQLTEGRKQTGTGLGLVISSQLIEKMDGSMQMRSTPGRGTLIHVELPVAARPVQSVRHQEDMLHRIPQQPLSVLIVDDHPVNRMVLGRQLKQLGHQVSEATDGQEGLNKWKSSTVDLIITDCTMPGMDGYTLTRKIRASGSHVAILGLTANAQSDVREKGIASGMNDCLFKPLRLSQLESALRHVVTADAAPVLEDLLNLQGLKELFHQDEEMLFRLLQRICKENDADMAEIRRHFESKNWEALAGTLHKLGGAAQVIYSPEIDDLCNEAEVHCASQQVDEEYLLSQLNVLENRLTVLHFAIKTWLVKL